jgi:FkbM family methyltransferase
MLSRDIARKALKWLPLKRTLFCGMRTFGRPSGYRHLRFDGAFCVPLPRGKSISLMNANDYSLATEYFWRGITGWEAASISIWMNLCCSPNLGPTPTILDVGACEGIYALTAKAMCPDAQVFAFEPLPSAFGLLERNNDINGAQIDIRQVACSDADGVAELYFPSGGSTEATLVPGQSNRVAHASVKVEVQKLSTFFGKLGVADVDLVKIDTEGAERKVLDGMGDLLARCRPIMILEVLDQDAANALNGVMRPLDYSFWDINDDTSKGPLGLRAEEAIAKGICLNWLLVPREKVEAYSDCWRALLVV